MTSSNSASALLKSFASLVFKIALVLNGMLVDTVFDMLVAILYASASVVRRDLELMDAVQHCRNLVAFLVPN